MVSNSPVIVTDLVLDAVVVLSCVVADSVVARPVVNGSVGPGPDVGALVGSSVGPLVGPSVGPVVAPSVGPVVLPSSVGPVVLPSSVGPVVGPSVLGPVVGTASVEPVVLASMVVSVALIVEPVAASVVTLLSVVAVESEIDKDKPEANESESKAVKSSASEFSIVDVTEDSISSSVLEESTSQSAVKLTIAFPSDLRFLLLESSVNPVTVTSALVTLLSAVIKVASSLSMVDLAVA